VCHLIDPDSSPIVFSNQSTEKRTNISNGDVWISLVLNYVEGFQSHNQETLVKTIISESTNMGDGSVGWSVPGSFRRVGDSFWEGNTGIFYALIMYCMSGKQGEV